MLKVGMFLYDFLRNTIKETPNKNYTKVTNEIS